MEKEFEIWSEGYRTNGESSQAHFHGKSRGKDFIEACQNFFKGARYFSVHRPEEIYTESELSTLERLGMTEPTAYFWGCKLYDNETDARKNFG